MATWPVQVVIGSAYVVLAIVAAFDSVVTLPIILIAVLAWLLQWGVTWLGYRGFLARPWWRRHRRTSAFIILIIVMIATIVTVLAFGAAASDTDGWTVLWRFAITLVATALVLLLIDSRQDLARLRRTQGDLQVSREQAVDLVMEQRRSVVERIVAMLSESFGESDSGRIGSDRLRRLAREQVRPLSHELAEAMPPLMLDRSTSVPPYSWRQVVDEIAARPLLRPLVMASAVAVLFMISTFQTGAGASTATRSTQSGNQVAVTIDLEQFIVVLLTIALVFLATWGISGLAVRVTSRLLPRLATLPRVVVAVGTVIILAAAVIIVIQVAYLVDPFDEGSSGSWLRQVWVFLPIVLIAFLIAVGRSLTEFLNALRLRLQDSIEQLEWETVRLTNTIGQERKYFAAQLHGPIQSVVAAAALRMEAIDAPGHDIDSTRAELETAIQALGEGPTEERDVRAEIARLQATWAGVCEVYPMIPDSIVEALQADWVAGGTVSDLLVEAVANAAMHGSAQQVWIQMDWSGVDLLTLVVTDDGTAGLSENRGLGSALLDETTVRWHRESLGTGVRLEIDLAAPALMQK